MPFITVPSTFTIVNPYKVFNIFFYLFNCLFIIFIKKNKQSLSAAAAAASGQLQSKDNNNNSLESRRAAPKDESSDGMGQYLIIIHVLKYIPFVFLFFNLDVNRYL